MHFYAGLMNRFLPFLILAFGLLATAAQAQRVDSVPPQPSGMGVRIIAVVNDNVITTTDIESRIKLAMLSSGLPENQEVAQRLFPQVLRSLVDEQLQMQEARRLDITVTKEEIDTALQRIAQDNRIPDMKAHVASRGASPEALVDQVRHGLAWNKVVQRSLRPRVDVSDEEVDATIARMQANAGKEEFLVSEIFLTVDDPKDEEQIKQFAENLVQQLKSGANFSAVARQFSQGTGAGSGGDIGWIQEGQLAPELNRALAIMQAGEVTGPIRSTSGYHVIGLREKRTIAVNNPEEISLSLQQAFRPYASGSKDQILQEGMRLKETLSGCANLQSQISEKFPNWRLQNMGDAKLSKIPSWITAKIRDVQTGKASEPLETDKGAIVFFVCEKNIPEGNISREAVTNSIGTEKLELQARRLMRDLRRSAYLDIRLPSSAP